MDIRQHLSTLWIFILFNMAFADIVGLAYPGTLAALIAADSEGVTFGNVEGIAVTPALLLLAAVFIETAIVMVVAARLLPRVPNRIANATAAIATGAFVIGGGSATAPYLFFAACEIAALSFILILAWRWPHDA